MSTLYRPAAAPVVDLRPQALYRFFAADGTLLYVGITANVGLRWKQHADSKPWWTQVHQATITHYPNRDAVEAAEKAAIKSERPRYNVVHNASGTAPLPPLVADLVVAGRAPSPLAVVAWANWLMYFAPVTHSLAVDLALPSPWLPAVVFAAYLTFALLTGRDVRTALVTSAVMGTVGGAHGVGLPLPPGGWGAEAAASAVVVVTLVVLARVAVLAGGRRRKGRRR